MSRTKCVVIREELVSLTGDYKKAIVLGQLIYWSERVRDHALYLEEEQDRYENAELSHSITHGWFYKRAEDLSEETMMGVKPKAMREYVKHLVEQGWVDEKRPTDKLDRTLHYRVNLVKVHQDLQELGYTLKRCTTHAFLPIDEKETTRCVNKTATHQKETATREKEAPTAQKPLSNRRKRTLATLVQENTSSPEPITTQGFQAMDSLPEIKEQRLQDSESTHTQPEERVCARIMELFGKKLSRTKVRTLMDRAGRDGTDLDEAIENTYTYHTTVEKCRSISGAILYAIENGGWEMCSSGDSKKPSKPVPKSLQQRGSVQEKAYDSEEFERKRKRYRAKMERAGYVWDEKNGKWLLPETWYV